MEKCKIEWRFKETMSDKTPFSIEKLKISPTSGWLQVKDEKQQNRHLRQVHFYTLYHIIGYILYVFYFLHLTIVQKYNLCIT